MAGTMSFKTWSPSPVLAPFVDEYGLREARLGETLVYNPLPARSNCFLEFFFEERYGIVDVSSGLTHLAPRCALVGPHTGRREDLVYSGTLKVFTIRFSPIGFYSLFGVPTRLIRNWADCADLVLGASVRELEEKLADAREGCWREIAETFLIRRLSLSKTAASGNRVAAIAATLKRDHGTASIGDLAASHQISTRQLERTFKECIGVSPKMLARLERLKFALQLLQADEVASWSGLANEAGYYDESHMVREFRSLTKETPVRFRGLRQRATQCIDMTAGKWDAGFLFDLDDEQSNNGRSGKDDNNAISRR